jgi:hypothetical protein
MALDPASVFFPYFADPRHRSIVFARVCASAWALSASSRCMSLTHPYWDAQASLVRMGYIVNQYRKGRVARRCRCVMPIKRLAAQSASTTTMVSSVPMARTLATRLTRVEGCTRRIHRSRAGCGNSEDKRPLISCRYLGGGPRSASGPPR